MPVSNHNVEYFLFNSAANLKAYSNNGLDFAYYGYNASNTRTYKLSMLNQNQWVNGQPQPLNLQLQSAMFYPNAYINFNQNGEYTKHYYNGAERIASRLGTVTLNIATTANARLDSRSTQVDNRFQSDIHTLVYAEDVSVDYDINIQTTSLQQTGTATDIFYYHTNHLGSTAYVTDQSQNITQGFLYAPFGEITTEYAPLWQNGTLPKYSFNAKELDEETGMYYYEARYYKPPVFTSRDPMFEKYFWMTPYAYCANNPVKYVDPDGRTIWVTDGKIKYQYRQDNEGNWGLYTIKPNGEIGSAYSKKSNSFIDNVLSDLETIRNTNDAEIQKRFNYIVSSESKRQIIEQQEENVKVSQYAAIKTKDGRYTGKGEIKYNRDDINGGPATLVHELLGHAYSHSMGTFSDDINKNIVIGKNNNNQEQINAINIENIYRHASGMSPRTEDLGSDGFYDVSKYLNQNILKLWE